MPQLIPLFAIAGTTAASTVPNAAASLGANPLSLMLLLALLSMLPFVLMMSTSFLKFAVVLSLLRQALGTQQVPPTPVIMGLSMILTVYVMSPVLGEVYAELEPQIVATDSTEMLSGKGAETVLGALKRAAPALKGFLVKHAHGREVEAFHAWSNMLRSGATGVEPLARDSLLVLIPAFAVSELNEAFTIGFLLFLPFLIIDMVVSNILLAMGMHMLSPVVVSLPFKLLLFIMIDGWALLTRGLLQPYFV